MRDAWNFILKMYTKKKQRMDRLTLQIEKVCYSLQVSLKQNIVNLDKIPNEIRNKGGLNTFFCVLVSTCNVNIGWKLHFAAVAICQKKPGSGKKMR